MKKHEMTENQKKDFVISEQQRIIRDYQLRLAQAGVKLSTDDSTRKKAIEDFIHNEKLLKEKACEAC